MSRLIDADSILLSLDKRRTYELDAGRNKAYGKGVRDSIKDVENAPTVDAIPVERIISWSNKRYRETQMDVSIVDVLEAWQQNRGRDSERTMETL